MLRSAVLGGLLAASTSVSVVAPTPALAAGPAVVATSASAQAFQYSAQDRVAYLPDGSLLVGYWQSSSPAGAYINHVTNPSTTPVSTNVQTIFGGDEVSIITSGNDIWIQVGSELDGLPKLEQVLHGVFLGGTSFSWPTLPQIIPGALTTGRQDPSLAWNGTDLIATWWDDTMGGNSDNIFYNWTADKSGATGWAVSAKAGKVSSGLVIKNGTTASAFAVKSGTATSATVAPASSIGYTVSSGSAPAVGEWFEFGTGTADAEVAQVTGVTGAAPNYVLAVSLTKPHAMGEVITTATVITYTAGVGGAPAVGDLYEFGSGLGTSETRTITAVAGSAPYILSVAALANSHGSGETDTTATRVTYAVTSGAAPAVGDSFQIGHGNNCPCNAELRTVTAVSGSGPYILSVAALSSSHPSNEEIRIEAKEFSATGTNSVQVAIRHSSRLNATIAVFGTRCQIWYRVLSDGNNPTTGWSNEALVDPNNDDCEGNFGGPQITIDESSGRIHVFKAVTSSNSPDWSGITYWNGILSGSAVSWSSRLIIDATGVTATDPPDVTGAIDSSGKVYIFWATSVTGGGIKFVTLSTPYTTPSAISTATTTGANPRFPHIPAQAPLTGGYVPLFYQSGTGPYNIILDTRFGDNVPPTVPAGLTAVLNASHGVNLAWSASTDNVGVTGYQIWRNGVVLTSVSGTTLAYADNSVSGFTTYTYAVDAFDAAGNHSAQSATATVTTGSAAPCQVPGVAATPASGAVVGSQVTLTATTSGCPNPLYEFWLKAPGGSWAVTQAYSASATFFWNTASPVGTYYYSVWVRDASSLAGYDNYLPGTPYMVTSTACSSVTASASPASPQVTGTAVSITATAAAGCSNPQYEFWIQPPGGSWTVAQAYAGTNAFNWNTTGATGTYHYSIWVRDAASSSPYDAYFPGAAYVLTATACSSVSASAAPPSPQLAGTTITITATAAAGCSSPQYEFWTQPPGGAWTVAQAYSPSATFSWNTTGLTAGNFHYSVWVRNAGSGASYDAYFPGTIYTLTSNACSGVSASASPPSTATSGTTVTITAAATGCPNARYEFWIQAPGGAWTIVQGYTASATFTWNTTGQTPGTYHYSVWVRDATSGAAYDAYFPGTAYNLT